MSSSALHVEAEYAKVDLGNYSKIAVAGDWHGDGASAKQVIYRAVNEGAEAIFQLGDFGLWPGPVGKAFLNTLESAAAAVNINIYWLDGNHEDFNRLELRRRPENALTQFSEHVIHLGRGTRWVLGDVSFCAVGGAVSLDRQVRIPDVSWWPQEELTALQCYAIKDGGPVDVLFSHDVSHEVAVPGINHRVYTPIWPTRELERTWLHRERLGELTAALKPTHLFHGHFHTAYSEFQTMSFGETSITGLADNFNIDGNMVLIDIDDLADQVAEIRMGREP